MATTNVAKHGEATTEVGPVTAIKQVRADLHAMESQFANALPPHIPVARFMRVVMTALQNNPKLLACNRQSLFNACMQAAQDGLLPDGREGAIVPYGTDEETGRSSADVARWMPMVFGIRKKVRNSGALADWNCQVVQEGDEFEYQLGDDPFIHHKPAMKGGRARKVVAAYSIAVWPDGTKSREVMNADQIEDIRKKSRAKKGPWSDPVFYPEMARKTVARLHSKQLPMSTDLDTLLRRDDDLYDFREARDEGKRITPPGSARAVLDHFAHGGEPAPDPAPQARELPSPLSQPDTDHDDGRDGEQQPQHDEPKLPTNEAEYRAFAEAYIDAATGDPKALNEWWQSAGQRRTRNACNVLKETYDALAARVKDKCAALEGA